MHRVAHALLRRVHMLDTLIPAPRKVEESAINLGAVPGAVWDHLRHGDLVDSPFVRALFLLRTLPARLRSTAGAAEPLRVRVDDFRSTHEQPGFQRLGEDPPHELTVGAIGKVFQLDIPFVHVDGPEAYTKFNEPGWVKVAWAVRGARLAYPIVRSPLLGSLEPGKRARRQR